MEEKKLLTIQDISCFGQCSLTVALPIISACGIETAIMPAALLSTHTGGFKDFAFRDLTEDLLKIKDHWIKENIKFDAIYTGYLGSERQIDIVIEIMDSLLNKEGLKIVDPAMADNGMLYTGFDMKYVQQMEKLVTKADIFMPNLTEACLLTGIEYRTDKKCDSKSGKVQDIHYIESILDSLSQICSGKIILKGIMYQKGKLGVCIYDCKSGKKEYVFNDRVGRTFHGTGDCYASAFIGQFIAGKDAYEAAKIAGEFVLDAIKNTLNYPRHKYGVKFENSLKLLLGK